MSGSRTIPRVQGQATHCGWKNGHMFYALFDTTIKFWCTGAKSFGIFQPTIQTPPGLVELKQEQPQTAEEETST